MATPMLTGAASLYTDDDRACQLGHTRRRIAPLWRPAVGGHPPTTTSLDGAAEPWWSLWGQLAGAPLRTWFPLVATSGGAVWVECAGP